MGRLQGIRCRRAQLYVEGLREEGIKEHTCTRTSKANNSSSCGEPSRMTHSARFCSTHFCNRRSQVQRRGTEKTAESDLWNMTVTRTSPTGCRRHHSNTRPPQQRLAYNCTLRKQKSSPTQRGMRETPHCNSAGDEHRDLTDTKKSNFLANNAVQVEWATFTSHRQELTTPRCPLKDRLQLFDATVTPSLVYASGTWTTIQETKQKLQKTRRRMLNAAHAANVDDEKPHDFGSESHEDMFKWDHFCAKAVWRWSSSSQKGFH